jgi:maleylpyruvate isomerase
VSGSDTPDAAAVARDVESCAASHAALVAHLGAADPADPTAPSRLPDWTLGHVLTHIARNGDSHVEMLAGRPQYPGVAERNADIAAGAGRPWGELVADVERSCAAVDRAFGTRGDWSGNARTMAGERPVAMLPLLRQREIEVHRVDLGLGYEFEDMPGDYVRRDLSVMSMLWTARQPMGMARLPETALAEPPPARLAWLMGRRDIDGLGPAGLF